MGKRQFRIFCLLVLFFYSGLSATMAALPAHDGSGQQLPSLAPMLKKVNPAVVNISTYATQKIYNPLFNHQQPQYKWN